MSSVAEHLIFIKIEEMQVALKRIEEKIDNQKIGEMFTESFSKQQDDINLGIIRLQKLESFEVGDSVTVSAEVLYNSPSYKGLVGRITRINNFTFCDPYVIQVVMDNRSARRHFWCTPESLTKVTNKY